MKRRHGWIPFVAGRYFFAKRRERNVASTVLSATGIGLGVAALIVVIAVMNGFQSSFISPLMEISSYHLRVPLEGVSDPDALQAVLRSDKRVLSVARFTDTQVILEGAYGSVSGANLRLVGKEAFSDDRGFVESLGLGTLASLPAGRSLLIGSELAYGLGLKEGDFVDLLSVRNDEEQGLVGDRQTFTVAGIFKSGYYPIDRAWAIGLLSPDDPLLSGADSGVTLGLKLRSPEGDAAFLASPPEGTGEALSGAVSWREYNRAFFGALRMEKILMYCVIALIFAVVAVNVFHSMRRSVFERHEEIGLLRGLGASPRDVSLVFVMEGAAIGLSGALAGLCAGLLLSANVNQLFHGMEAAVNLVIDASNALLSPAAGQGNFALFSPAYFYIEEVPTKIYFPEACLSFLSGALSAVFAAWAASRSVARFQPQEILRYE